jgi:hypothetical protein
LLSTLPPVPAHDPQLGSSSARTSEPALTEAECLDVSLCHRVEVCPCEIEQIENRVGLCRREDGTLHGFTAIAIITNGARTAARRSVSIAANHIRWILRSAALTEDQVSCRRALDW